MQIHPAFREVFGERQTRGVVLAVLAGGTVATLALVAVDPDTLTAVPPWRAALAALVIWDIACGCLANATRSTNDYYAQRPRHRRIFLAVHVHLLAVAALLGTPLLPALIAWAYTIALASLVNRLSRSPHQLLVALSALAGAAILIPFLADLTPLMAAVCLLFAMKVIVAFAIDHTAAGRPLDVEVVRTSA